MKNLRASKQAEAIALMIALILCLAIPAKAQHTYTVTDLGSAAGAQQTVPNDINIEGDVAAASFVSLFPVAESVGFVAKDGQLIFVPTLGGQFSVPSAINDLGEVAGSANFAGDTIAHAVTWDRTLEHVTDLGTLGGATSDALWLNANGEVVGQSVISNGIDSHAFHWLRGTMSDLGTLGGANSLAFVNNDAGLIVGQSDITTVPDPTFGIPQFHGFLWVRGIMNDLGEIFGGHFNMADGINDRGEIAGGADLAGDLTGHAFLLRNGSFTDLGTVPGDTNSGAANLNNLGQVVGISGSVVPGFPPASVFECPCHATIWENGRPTDLNTVIPPDSGWQLIDAIAINDRGQIVGVGTFGSDLFTIHAFLLTPQVGDASSSAASAAQANADAPQPQPSQTSASPMRLFITNGRPRIVSQP